MQEGDLIRIVRPVRMHQQTDRRMIRVMICLYLLLALISWLTLPVLPYTSLVPAGFRAATVPEIRGAVLMIAGPQESLAGYGLLRDMMAASGFASCLHVLPVLDTPEFPASTTKPGAGSAIGQAIDELAGLSGFPADMIWVIAGPHAAQSVFAGLDPASAAGLIMLTPLDWPEQAAALRSGWADHGRLAILAAPTADMAANRFYESVTGEDATLFPGYPLQQEGGGTAWLSVDGRVALTLLPGLVDVIALISPRVLAEVITRLYDWQGQPSSASLTSAATVARQVASQLYRLAVSLVLLLSVPFVISLLLGRDERQASDPAAGSSIAGELLFWLAALIVAATLSWLLHHFVDSRISWPGWLVLLAPACHGWIHYLWRAFVLQPEQAVGKSGETARIRIAVLPAALLLPALLVLILLPVPDYWLPGQRIWLILLAVVSLPIGPVGSGSVHLNQSCPGKAGRSGLIRFMPWLLLPPVMLLVYGFQSALAALLITLAACWSGRCGLAVARISHSRWLASLVQAACHVGLILPLAAFL